MKLFRLLLVLQFFLLIHPSLNANCTVPSLLTVNQVSDSSVTLTWTDVGDAYQLEVRLLSETFTGVPTHNVPNDPPFTISGLVPGEQYRFRVRTVCTAGGGSNWSTARNFSTEINNERPCPLDFTIRDTTCSTTSQIFNIYTHNAPGNVLGTTVYLRGLRLGLTHPWRSDLRIWLISPDGTRTQVLGGLNAGDQNLGNPTGNGGCGQYLELTDDPSAPLLSTAAEQDNITGYWQALNPLTIFNNGQNPNGIWQLEICDNKLNHTGKLKLVQLVFEAADCATPNPLQVSDIQLNTVKIAWDSSTVTADSIELAYGAKGFLPETSSGQRIQLASNATQPFTITGLNGLQDYDVFVRQRCAPGLWSGFSAPATFFTVCPAVIVEDFNAIGICPTACTDPCPLPNTWQNVPGDDFEWKVRTGQGITYPTAGPPAAVGGTGNYLFFRNSCSPSGANGKKAILRTLCLDISAPSGTSCHFSLDIYMFTKLGQMGSLTLEGSTDGGVTWLPIQTWSGNRGKQWRREFVNLSAYNNKTALFQLTATGVFGAYGDIAVDNLTFYSATPAGTPDYTFYRDADNDGYGSNTNRVIVCSPNAPVGFIAVSGDCNDNAANINPAATEIKCNGIDENCNGNADDNTIPTPVLNTPSPVCRGGNITLSASSTAFGQLYWFNAAVGGQLLGTGNTLALNNLQNNTNLWVIDSFAVGGCKSVRTPIAVTVVPKPNLVLGMASEICLGNTLDLSDLPINDLDLTNGTLRFHTGFPTSLANQLSNTNVQPAVTTTYFAQKTTSNGCFDTVSIPIIVHPNPTVSVSNGDSLALCKGKNILLAAVGVGNTPLAYTWSNGFNQINVNVLANGTGFSTSTYTVTLTDVFGCTAKDAIKITTLPGVSQTNVIGLQNVNFCGGNNGSIALQALDGLAPYTFNWAGPNLSSGSVTGIGTSGGSITGLTQGGYRITVTDATGIGCTMVLPSLVINAPGLTVNTPVVTQPTCPEGKGSIGLNVVGNTPVYLWSNNATTADVQDLLPGSYTVTITDGACQQVISDLKIIAPPTIQILQNQIVPVDCAGNSTGLIDLNITGGTGAYSYLWNDNITTADRNNIPAGNYQVTVTDASGCTKVSPIFTLAQPNPLSVNTQITPVKCHNATNGAAQIAISGGVSAYFVEWSTGAFDTNLQNLSAGTYTVTVIDQNACSVTKNIVVGQPTALSLQVLAQQNPTCAGKQDGLLHIGVTGGMGVFNFLWNNGATTAQLTNMEDGKYTLSVTDANGCTLQSPTYTLTAPQVLKITLHDFKNVRCYSGNNGAIDLSISGATGGLMQWMNGVPVVFPQNNLLANAYQIVAKDGLGCTWDTTFIVQQPESPLTLSAQQIGTIPCNGAPTGNININTKGGTAPYTYLWSNGATTEDLDAALAGNYSMIATDAKNCQAGILDLVLTEAPPVSVAPYIEDIPCLGAPYGKILLSVNGGTAPYSYQWSNGATTANIYDLPAGNYIVSIFDATGCLTVYERLEILDKRLDFEVQFVGYQPVSCNAQDNGELTVKVNNGTPPYQYSWSAPVGLHPNIATDTDTANGLSGGQYKVTVTDASGCFSAAGPFTVEEAPPVVVQVTAPDPITCKGAATGTILTKGVGGVPSLQYIWSNGGTTATIDTLSSGFYTVTITDTRGCTTVSAPIFVPEPEDGLLITTDQLQNDACSTSKGAIFTTITGGFPGYQFMWNTGNNTSDLINLAAATYTLTVVDQKGCTQTNTWTIPPAPPAMVLASYSITPVACKSGSDGAIETGIMGGNLPLQYFWNNGATKANIDGLAAGNYRVTVLDQEGCQSVFTLPPVTEPALPITVTSVSTMQTVGFSVTLNCSGGIPGYDAVWDNSANNQTGLTANNLTQGYYNVTVTDGGGCTKIALVYAGTSSSNEAENTDQQVMITPNPSHGAAYLQFKAPAMHNGTWQLCQIDGRIMATGNWEIGAERVKIGDEVLGAGVYLVVLGWDDGGLRGLRMVVGLPH
jgi:subtilisin-like proprotein convertase family protein